MSDSLSVVEAGAIEGRRRVKHVGVVLFQVDQPLHHGIITATSLYTAYQDKVKSVYIYKA